MGKIDFFFLGGGNLSFVCVICFFRVCIILDIRITHFQAAF